MNHWFDENFYLQSKLAQLQANKVEGFNTVADVKAAIEGAGYTVEQHFNEYHSTEMTSPNADFNTVEYINAKLATLDDSWTFDSLKDAMVEACGSVYEHYADFGAYEGINPSNNFDAQQYLQEKVQQLNSTEEDGRSDWTVEQLVDALKAEGMTPLDHFHLFGAEEKLHEHTVPADQQVSDQPVEPVVEFTLENGLEALNNAEAAKVDFLSSIDLKGAKDDEGNDIADGKGDFVTDGALDGDAAIKFVADRKAEAIDKYETETKIDYDEDSAALQAAKLLDARNADATALKVAQEGVAKAQEAINSIDGLQDKIDTVKELGQAEIAAEKAAEKAEAHQSEVYSDTHAIADHYETSSEVKLTTDVGFTKDSTEIIGTVSDGNGELIVTNDNSLVLKDGVTEENHEGITELLNAYNAYNDAITASNSAKELKTSAQDATTKAELSSILVAAQSAVDEFMETEDNSYSSMLTQQIHMQEEIVDAVASLEKDATSYDDVLNAIIDAIKDVKFDTDEDTTEGTFKTTIDSFKDKGFITEHNAETITKTFNDEFSTNENISTAKDVTIEALKENNLQTHLDDFSELISDFAAAKADNDAYEALKSAEEHVNHAQENIQALDDAITELNSAEDMSSDLSTLEDAVKAAQKALTDHDFALPVQLAEDADHIVIATADNDIFMMSGLDGTTEDVSITGFADEDVLFIGKDYTWNKGDIAEDGDNAVREIFFEQKGADVHVSFEQKAFASNEANSDGDMVEITLQGVSVDDLAVHDGFITMA